MMGIAKKTRPIAFKLIIISVAAKTSYLDVIHEPFFFMANLCKPWSIPRKQMSITLNAKPHAFRSMHHAAAPPASAYELSVRALNVAILGVNASNQLE